MLDPFWIVCTVPPAVGISIFACVLLRRPPKIEEKLFPHESPFTAIYLPKKHKNLLTQSRLWFQVSFRVTRDKLYWLTPDQIIKHCQRHQQNVPEVVSNAEHRWTGNLNVGDDLLKISI